MDMDGDRILSLNPPYLHQPETFLADVERIIRKGQFVDGEFTKAVENQIGNLILRSPGSSKKVLLVNNGMGALELALMSFNIGPGDTVVTTPFTFKATYQAIKRVGATPLFIDINDDLTMNRSQLAYVMDKYDIAGIIPVDIFGIPNDIDALREVVSIWPPYIIEDAAQALGAEINGSIVGGKSDTTILSFYPTKLRGVGNAGAVISNVGSVIEDVDRFARYGSRGSQVGGNYRASEWDAAALSSNLIGTREAIVKRRENAKFFEDNVDAKYMKIVDAIPRNVNPSWHHFPIWSESNLLEKDPPFEIKQYYHDNFSKDDKEVYYCANFLRMVNNIYVIPVHEHLGDYEKALIADWLNNS
jgi:dTDP-4-amino-4,6-dideoxygalactose transaminase